VTLALYMDEHIHKSITTGLRQRGIDVLTVQEDNHAGTSDQIILDRSTKLERVIFTQDDDFLAIAHRRQTKGIFFSGVIYAHQQNVTVGDCIRDLEMITQVCEPKDCYNYVQYLPL
jgi:predicted nuclease of predicted toxin-antitoxin system